MTGTTTANLNLRKGAGTSYAVIRVLPKGTQVSISGQPVMVGSTPWYKVTEGEDTGWVSGAFLTGISEAPGANQLTKGAFLDACLDQLGKPYRWGGNGPANFDCSGYVGYIWRQLGIRSGDYTADAMFDNFRTGVWPATKVEPDDVQIGDVIFYGNSTYAGHVVFGISPGHVLGATGGGMATTTDAKAKEQGACVRIDKATAVGSHGITKDCVGIYRPAIDWKDES